MDKNRHLSAREQLEALLREARENLQNIDNWSDNIRDKGPEPQLRPEGMPASKEGTDIRQARSQYARQQLVGKMFHDASPLLDRLPEAERAILKKRLLDTAHGNKESNLDKSQERANQKLNEHRKAHQPEHDLDVAGDIANAKLNEARSNQKADKRSDAEGKTASTSFKSFSELVREEHIREFAENREDLKSDMRSADSKEDRETSQPERSDLEPDKD